MTEPTGIASLRNYRTMTLAECSQPVRCVRCWRVWSRLMLPAHPCRPTA